MPLAGFSVITAGLSVRLTNNSADADGYEWDFGDGTPVSTELNPTHTYTDEVSYTITLTATTGTYACQNVYQTEVTVGKYKVYLPMVTR